MIVSPLVLSLVLAADAPPAPKLPVGKDTTYVAGPLDADGYIDYEAALNDRLGKDITPEKNANVLIWKAFGPTPEGGNGMPAEYFRRLGMDAPPKEGDYFISLGHFLRDKLQVDSGDMQVIFEQETRAGRRPWAAKDYPALAEWLKINEKPLAVIVEATRRPDYYDPLICPRNGNRVLSLIGALLPAVQKCRESAQALTMRAMLRVQEGKFDDAWQDLQACHRLGRLIGRGGTLIEALVGFAIDVIASNADLAYLERADLTAAQLRDRIKDLQTLPPTPPLADKIDLCERFEYLESAQLVRRWGVVWLDALAEGSAGSFLQKPGTENKLSAIDWAPVLRNGNAWYDRIAAAMRIKDRAERSKELDRIDNDVRTLKPAISVPWVAAYILLGKDPPDAKAGKIVGRALLALLTPAVSKVQQAHDRDEQVQRNLQVAFALAAYRADHGTYPMRLGDLAPKYLTDVPDDLFAGGPLVYHPWVKGYTLYSVGVNGQDDGGRFYDDDPPGDDLRVAMPLPELRMKK